MTTLFALLVIYQLKHFICDYPLQNTYMLGKFNIKGWVTPLAAHCGVHAIATFLIAYIVSGDVLLAVGVSLFDFVIHFVMNRIKASPNILGKFKIEDKRFWWSLGLDQMVHHITHYVIIAILIL